MIVAYTDEPIYSTDEIQRLLLAGKLFSFDVTPSAYRAYLHANASTRDAALKSILNATLDGSGSSPASLSLRKFRSTLNAVNQALITKIYYGDLPKCDTLLEQLIQEEQIIQAYVKQIVENKTDARIRQLSKGKIQDLITPQDDNTRLRRLCNFFRWLPQYCNSEQTAHIKVLDTCDQEKIDQFELRTFPEKTASTHIAFFIKNYPIIFALIAVFSQCLLVGVFGPATMALTLPLTFIILVAFSEVVYNWNREVERMRFSAEEHLFPLVPQFCTIVKQWNDILAPKTFEQKWALRAYFALMHSNSLDNAYKFKDQQLMTFHNLDVDQFVYLMYQATAQSMHSDPSGYNPYFDHSH